MICCGGKVEVATASANDVVFGGVAALESMVGGEELAGYKGVF